MKAGIHNDMINLREKIYSKKQWRGSNGNKIQANILEIKSKEKITIKTLDTKYTIDKSKFDENDKNLLEEYIFKKNSIKKIYNEWWKQKPKIQEKDDSEKFFDKKFMKGNLVKYENNNGSFLSMRLDNKEEYKKH